MPVKMMMDHVNEQPVPPSQRSELDISQRLEEVILTCLEKEPDHRPQDADALAGLLQECGPDAPVWTADRAGQWWDQHAPA